MKNDRLYAMTLYLLNHGRTTGRALAERFEVSVRTVRRDVDALCRAGIPVVTLNGAGGGYELDRDFCMDRRLTTPQERAYMRTALRGLATAGLAVDADAALEKLPAAHGAETNVVLDFSVLGERDGERLRQLQRAIAERRAVRFGYTNAEGMKRVHTVEPIAVVYRWYAWYLLAWSRVREDYRTYKLARMDDVEATGELLTQTHPPAEEILRERDGADGEQCMEIEVRCAPEARIRAIEYLNGTPLQTYENGDVRMRLRVLESEQLWFGTLLSMGGRVEVLSPEHVRRRMLEAAKEIVGMYEKR